MKPLTLGNPALIGSLVPEFPRGTLIFSDDFNRADGPLQNANWNPSPFWSVDNNRIVGNGFPARMIAASPTQNQAGEIDILTLPGNNQITGLVTRLTDENNFFYRGCLENSGGNYWWRMYARVASWTVAAEVVAVPPAVPFRLRFEARGGVPTQLTMLTSIDNGATWVQRITHSYNTVTSNGGEWNTTGTVGPVASGGLYQDNFAAYNL